MVSFRDIPPTANLVGTFHDVDGVGGGTNDFPHVLGDIVRAAGAVLEDEVAAIPRMNWKFVEQYGTVHGDGTNSDWPALQDFLADLGPGDLGWLPKRLCIDRPIEAIGDGWSIRGRGMGAAQTDAGGDGFGSRIELLPGFTGSNTDVFTIQQNNGTRARPAAHIGLHDFTIDGGGVSGTPIGTGLNGTMFRILRGRISNVGVHYMSGNGLQLQQDGSPPAHTYDTLLYGLDIGHCKGKGLAYLPGATDIQLVGGNFHANSVNWYWSHASSGQSANFQCYAALGKKDIVVTAAAIAANVATLTVASTASLTVGQWVYVAVSDGVFNGEVQVASIPNGTHFTYALTHANITTETVTGVVQTDPRDGINILIEDGGSRAQFGGTVKIEGADHENVVIFSPTQGAGDVDFFNARFKNPSVANAGSWSNVRLVGPNSNGITRTKLIHGTYVVTSGDRVGTPDYMLHLGDAVLPRLWGGDGSTGGRCPQSTVIIGNSFGDGALGGNSDTTTGLVLLDHSAGGLDPFIEANFGLAKNDYDTINSSAAPIIDVDRVAYFSLYALNTDIVDFGAQVTGTPRPGQRLTVYIDTQGASTHTIAYLTMFEDGNVALPTSVGPTPVVIDCVWNERTSKFRRVA